MSRFLPWFLLAIMLAATAAECGSERMAGADNTYLLQQVAEMDTLREQAAKLQVEKGRLERELICERDNQGCDHLR